MVKFGDGARATWGFVAAFGAAALFAGPALAGWMAYAIDDRGAVGHGLSPDRQTARNFALSYCGNGKCRVVETTDSRCVALAESYHNGYWVGIGRAPSLGAAKGYAINWCAKNAPAATCRLRHNYCQ